jgi:hypothetical protein
MVKEKGRLIQIGKLSGLKTLDVHSTYGMDRRFRHPNTKKYKLHQENERISTFSAIPGFDKLVQIRGLQRVTVTASPNDKYNPEKLKAAKYFEHFLNNIDSAKASLGQSKAAINYSTRYANWEAERKKKRTPKPNAPQRDELSI